MVKYCTPNMFSLFVCTLLSFCAHEFPAKSKTQEPGKIIVECTSNTTYHQTCPCQKISPVLLYIMRCLTGNVCYAVVINVQVFSYPVKRQIDIHQPNVQQYIFMSMETYHVINFMADIQKNTKQHVQCDTDCL